MNQFDSAVGCADGEVVDYYTSKFEEAARLRSGFDRLEYLRTIDILERILPEPPASVLDVGGGTGAYATWLRARGYEVHLIDPVPGHVELAKRALADMGSEQIWTAKVGHSGDLGHTSESVDVVLLMGPLYHLQNRDNRIWTLNEARRVLRVGGMVLAGVISKFASLIDGFVSGYVDDPAFDAIIRNDLETGQHINPTDKIEYFTKAYFHRPEELVDELCEASLMFEGLVAVEGPGWARRDILAVLDDEARLAQLMDLLRKVESEMSLIGVSPHILGIARKDF